MVLEWEKSSLKKRKRLLRWDKKEDNTWKINKLHYHKFIKWKGT